MNYIHPMKEHPVDLQFIARQLERVIDEQRSLRQEVGDVRSLVLAVSDQSRRLDRHLTDMQADLELTIKSEIAGRMANVESRIEARTDRIINEFRDPLTHPKG
ncbi:hypothetical protein JHC09_13615 [Devosia sp. MC532]|uniref:hypothetical protein n=1 Tax=Devosia sp. MC532 TaxID=2799788 RepID=UPI0018F3F98D|nr:hypothetical protein [Devosia sp. MC532]MBJ7578922.1 hypothetical protein [Devosia sp. MC532]